VKQVLIGCFCLLMLAGSAMGAVRYVDAAATGANNGGSPANAWTDLTYLDRSLGSVSAGDTVIIAAGEYTNHASVNLREGSTGNWTRYYVTNGLVHVHRPFGIKGYTELNGALNRAVTATDNLYALDSITNNIGLSIDRHDVTNGLVSGLYITGCNSSDHSTGGTE
jgi:hypothetical protein